MKAGENASSIPSQWVTSPPPCWEADGSGCWAQSSVPAVKASGALGKQAAVREMPSSGRERGGGFFSRHGCAEALRH